MPLPSTVRVKLSSEAAEAISLTPVVVQELPMRELIEHVLGLSGKDEARICDILLRGTLVSGASRFRWAGWEVDAPALRDLLATFPDPDAGAHFAAGRCIRAALRGGRLTIEIPRQAGEHKGMFQRSSFWDVLMEVAAAAAAEYHGYSYRDRADRFMRQLSRAEADRLREASFRVKYSTLRDQIATLGFTHLEMYVTR
jgi:hypothetical protein